ncbi:MAG: cytochrome c biogenesis protein CcsA [Akkermansiaceae bacterium]
MKTPPEISSPSSPSNLGLRWALVVVFLILQFGVITYAIRGSVPKDETRKVPGYTPWSVEVIEVAEKIPVQDGGRVKPFSTFARFELLRLQGAVSLEIESGGEMRKVTSTEWLLDCLFRPELADQLPVFRMDNTDVITGMGIRAKDRRDRLSFEDIEPGYDELMKRGRQLTEESESRKLKPNEKQVTEFAQQVLNYQALTMALDFARKGMQIDPTSVPEGVSNAKEFQSFSYWIESFPQVREAVRNAAALNGGEIPEALTGTLRTMEEYIAKSRFGLNWIPPYDDAKEWRPLGRTISDLIEGKSDQYGPVVADLRRLEELVPLADDPQSDAFLKALTVWQEDLSSRSEARGLGEAIPGEISYYKKRYFQKALFYFIAAFVISVLGWLVTQGKAAKVIQILTAIGFAAAVIYLIVGIFHRSWVMGRPPVGNLYDTIPFITAGATVILGIAELITKRRLLLSLGAFLGAAGLFLAFRFEYGDAKDHMDPLVAVLNSNYWLATHVVTVVLGYSGGLVACFLSQVYVHLRLAGVIEKNKSFQRFVTRAAYGIVCFTLFFSLVGTVLGGIWANDSWGRFWGWDPKENGALLIVIWSLIILHARLAGWMNDWGIHLACIFGGMIVAFSWWHVNMLEVGLHSYGFIKGGEVIWFFYAAEVIALIVGTVAYFIHRSEKASKRVA